jgi:hypothetical protein
VSNCASVFVWRIPSRCRGLTTVSEEIAHCIRPGKTKGALYFQGSRPTGYSFGKGHVQARLYNKTLETKEKANDA